MIKFINSTAACSVGAGRVARWLNQGVRSVFVRRQAKIELGSSFARLKSFSSLALFLLAIFISRVRLIRPALYPAGLFSILHRYLNSKQRLPDGSLVASIWASAKSTAPCHRNMLVVHSDLSWAPPTLVQLSQMACPARRQSSRITNGVRH